MSRQFESPVSVFFYRRPDHLRQVMAKIREVRPPILFGISDGLKPGNPEVLRGVEDSRKVFRETIDWPCRWELLERESNQGSYLSVSRGLDWVFERVSETIVLEDDTVPGPDFSGSPLSYWSNTGTIHRSERSVETIMIILTIGLKLPAIDSLATIILGGGALGSGLGRFSIGRKNSFQKFRKSKKRIG